MEGEFAKYAIYINYIPMVMKEILSVIDDLFRVRAAASTCSSLRRSEPVSHLFACGREVGSEKPVGLTIIPSRTKDQSSPWPRHAQTAKVCVLLKHQCECEWMIAADDVWHFRYDCADVQPSISRRSYDPLRTDLCNRDDLFFVVRSSGQSVEGKPMKEKLEEFLWVLDHSWRMQFCYWFGIAMFVVTMVLGYVVIDRITIEGTFGPVLEVLRDHLRNRYEATAFVIWLTCWGAGLKHYVKERRRLLAL
jgi:hypothetical protein